MTRNPVAFAVVMCGLAASVWAQTALPLAVDQRVRVTLAPETVREGRILEVGSDSFRLAVTDTDVSTIDKRAVKRLEVSRGVTSKGAGARKGAIRWALIMGAIGAISLGLQHEDVGEDGSSVGEAVALGLWSGGLFGGLIGAGVGAARAGEKWEQVWP
jgi:hypothetical protein